jgi:glycosyl transferase, family 25
MAKQLAGRAAEWTFVDAVDGKDLLPAELAKRYDDVRTLRAFGRPLTPPEIGCALSHREVYRRVLDQDLQTAIVLEDDAVLNESFFSFDFSEIKFSFEVISFYAQALVRLKADKAVSGIPLHRAAGHVIYAAGYLVSARGAARLHDATKRIQNVADWPVPAELLDFWVTARPLLEHSYCESTIEQSRVQMVKQTRAAHDRAHTPWLDFVGNGNIQYFTIPTFIKYFAAREKYLGVKDYVRREIVREIKLMLPWVYGVLNHDQILVRPPTIFVISLPDSPRRLSMERQLSRWPGKWTFIDAVDGHALSPSDLEKIYDPKLAEKSYGRPLALPEIGCALSHRLVYERMLAERLEYALVLEDDAILKDEFFNFPFLDIDVSMDIMSLYTSGSFVRQAAHSSIGNWRLHRAAGFANNTVGYLVTAQGADRLLAASKPVRFVADWPVPPEDMGMFVLSRSLVSHCPLGSTIQASRFEMEESARQAGDPIEDLPLPGWIKRILVLMFVKYLLQRNRYLNIRQYVRNEILRPRMAEALDGYMYLSHDHPDSH